MSQLGLATPVEVRASPRWLAVALPGFRLERLGWAEDEPVALIGLSRNATRLLALTPAAEALGWREGMIAAEARALAAEGVLMPLDEAAEADDRLALVRALRDEADHVEIVGDCTLLLERRQAGGEAAWRTAVEERLRRFGHRLRAVVAADPDVATALATWGDRSGEVSPGQEASWLAPLPVTALGPPERVVDALIGLGITTLGAWARLDHASVAGRWGPDAARLHALARGEVRAVASPRPAPADPLQVTRHAEEPAETVEAIIALVADAMRAVGAGLSTQGLASSRYLVTLTLEGNTRGPCAPVRLTLDAARPTADPEALSRWVRLRLERLRTEAPVTSVRVRAESPVPQRAQATDLWDRREDPEAWAALSARLEAVLGPGCLVRAATLPAWEPEHAWSEAAWLGGVPVGASSFEALAAADADDPVAWQEGALWQRTRPRPERLWPVPRPLHVETDGAGQPVRWRRVEGWLDVRSEGAPEILEGPWWCASGAFERVYRVVVDGQGTRRWWFEERRSWFEHGVFDGLDAPGHRMPSAARFDHTGEQDGAERPENRVER